MQAHGWSRSTLIRYALLQLPGIGLAGCVVWILHVLFGLSLMLCWIGMGLWVLKDVVLFFFGYSSCPDVCPTTLATWRRVHEALGEDAERVRFVFVTVDPERDTPERLGMHVDAFQPDFVGLTGSQAELEAVYQVFDVFHEKDTSSQSALGYLVSHNATTFVVDPQGQWRLRESYGTLVEDLVHDIRQLIE